MGWSRIPETLLSDWNDSARSSKDVTSGPLNSDKYHMVEQSDPDNTPESSFGRKLRDPSCMVD